MIINRSGHNGKWVGLRWVYGAGQAGVTQKLTVTAYPAACTICTCTVCYCVMADCRDFPKPCIPVQNDEERVFAGLQAPVVLPMHREGAADSGGEGTGQPVHKVCEQRAVARKPHEPCAGRQK